MKKQYLIIGLGKFGSSIAQTLVKEGEEVLVIDKREDLVNHAASYATQAVQMDATDERALEAMGIRNFDIVCVCIGEAQASIMITLLCKESGVNYVMAKAGSEMHAKVLKKVGADNVVFPERDSGIHMAYSLLSPRTLDFIELSPDYSITEFEIYDKWAGKSLGELELRKKYGVNIVAIRHEDTQINISPTSDDVLQAKDVVIAIGSEDDLDRVERAAEKG